MRDGDIGQYTRWRKVERVGARKTKLRMRDHYTDLLVSLRVFETLIGLVWDYGY